MTKAKKKPSIAKLKRKLDTLFSIFIRQRDRECYTCRKKYERLQAGHFISRSKSATRYDEKNTHAQCFSCNVWHRGMPAEYASRLIADYGIEEFNNLVKRGREIKQFKVKELEELIKKYVSKR